MSVSIDFDKQSVRAFVERLNQGQPLSPPEGGWTPENMLSLAGACFALLCGQGPAGVGESDNEEQDEAAWNTFYDEMHAAVEWCADRTMDVIVGDYDQQFDERHQATIQVVGEEMHVQPIAGFKESDEQPG